LQDFGFCHFASCFLHQNQSLVLFQCFYAFIKNGQLLEVLTKISNGAMMCFFLILNSTSTYRRHSSGIGGILPDIAMGIIADKDGSRKGSMS
jgi:hypothetical protein